MGRMDKVCSMCQAGVPHDCTPPEVPQEDLRRCEDCGKAFNRKTAKLGASCCPRCDREAGRGW